MQDWPEAARVVISQPPREISRDEFRSLTPDQQLSILASEPHRLANNIVGDQLWMIQILAQAIQESRK